MKPRREKPIESLVDAEPVWVDGSAGEERKGTGIIFNCPIHDEYCFTGVQFANPIDGGPPHDADGTPRWHRTGDTFETLTLSPSIRRLGGADGCEWHGFIRDGRFETCGDSR